ncbi:MAG: hypothetical protein J6N49_05895 [Alphaproteobacteria bacterium]|nr:hypothetical protein [Alphaproteobacteria bacterium]
MNKNVLVISFVLILAGAAGAVYWYGNQPNITYYPDGKMKTFVERKFFKENGAGKLYDEQGKLIHTYNVIGGKKNGSASVTFGEGEIKFGYFDNNIMGDMKVQADENVKDFADLKISANDGTLEIQKKNDDSSFKLTGQIVCADEPFILALQKLADERNTDNFIQFAKCLKVEKFRYTEDDGNYDFDMNGGFQYPDFKNTTTVSIKAPDFDNPTEMTATEFTVSDKDIKIKYGDEKGNIEISGNINGGNEEAANAFIAAYKKAKDDKFDYKAFEELAGKIELTEAKLTHPDVNCTYSGGFKYPGFVKDSKLECSAEADSDKIEELLKIHPEAKVFLSSMAGVERINTSLTYTAENDELSYTNKTDNEKMSVKITNKGVKKLIPIFVQYAFSKQNEDDNIKFIKGFLRNYTISNLETVINGKTVSKLDGSFNFTDGFSGVFSSKGYINDKIFANLMLKGRHLNIRVNYPLSDKPLGDFNVRFKENFAESYKKTVSTILQNMKSQKPKSEQLEQTGKLATNLANSLESADATLVNDKGKKIASAVAKIRPGADINDKNLALPEKFELSIYTYDGNNKPANVFKATKDGFYSDGKIISGQELLNIIGKEEVDNITNGLNKDFKEIQHRIKEGKLDISASPVLGVITIGAVAGYSKASSAYNINKAANQATMLAANIRTMYAQQQSYNGLDNVSAVKMGIVPDEMGKDAESGTLVHALGGPVYISSAKLSSDSTEDPLGDKAFVVTFSGLSREACVTMATDDWGSSADGFVGIGVYGYSLTKANKEDKDLVRDGMTPCSGSALIFSDRVIACVDGSKMSVPMQINTAVEACNCEGQDTCSITWKYF